MPATPRHDPLESPSPTAGPPSPTGTRPAPPGGSPGRGGALGFCLAWLAIAVGVGVALGVAAWAATRALADPSNTWADLVALVVAVFVAVLGAMTVWLIAMIVATRRFVPAGRRLGVLGWSVLVVVASPVLVVALFALVGAPSAPRGFVILTALVAMILAPTALVAARAPVAGSGQETGSAPAVDGVLES